MGRFKSILIAGAVFGLGACGQSATETAEPAAAPPATVVAVTAAPIHSMVAAVLGPERSLVLLIEPGQSPHTFALKPSTAAAIEDAAVIFRVGEGYETALDRPLQAAKEGKTVSELMLAPGVTLLPLRTIHDHGDEAQEEHGHDHDHAKDADHGHDREHGDAAAAAEAKARQAAGEPPALWADPHLWLDTENAIAMTEEILRVMTALEPHNATRFRANADAFIAEIRSSDTRARAVLAPVADKPFMVFHDAYQYFEARYGLNMVGAVTVSPDRAPSAKHLAELRKTIAEKGAACVFSEPQFEPRLIETITEGLPVKTASLDPLGTDLPLGKALYPALMDKLAADLADCLAP